MPQELTEEMRTTFLHLVCCARKVLKLVESEGRDTGVGGPFSDLRDAIEESQGELEVTVDKNAPKLSEQIADRLMFLSGINKMGTMLVPGIAALREADEIRGGSYNRDEVVRAIDEVLSQH